MGAQLLGMLGRVRFLKMNIFRLASDLRLTEVLNGKISGQIQLAKVSHLAHVVFQIFFK